MTVSDLPPSLATTGSVRRGPFRPDIFRGREPIYQQIASAIRGAITDGYLRAGHTLPSERELARWLDVGRDSVRAAVQQLVLEGLVVKQHGYENVVRPAPELVPVVLPAAVIVTARMPTPQDRATLDLEAGIVVPVLQVTPHDSGDSTLYAAHRVALHTQWTVTPDRPTST